MIPFFTCAGNFEALVFGYMKGLSDSTSSLSKDNVPSSRSFRIEFSDLSWNERIFKDNLRTIIKSRNHLKESDCLPGYEVKVLQQIMF